MADDRTTPRFSMGGGTPPPRANVKAAAKPAPSSARADAETVRRALATLDLLYGFVGSALILTGAPKTADHWAGQAERLTATNKEALEASPRLARMIANTGASGGALTLIATNAMALAPIYVEAQVERAERAEAAEAGGNPDEGRPTFADRIRRHRAEPDVSQETPAPTPPVRLFPPGQDATFIAGL